MVIIRKAIFKDFQKIVKIMKKSTSQDEIRGFVPPERIFLIFLGKLEKELKSSNPNVIVAEKEEIPEGFAYYTYAKDFVEIEEVDVIKEHQDQGIGRALIQRIEEIAKEKGINRLVTGTSINKDGKPWKAYGFWFQMGFMDSGERIQGLHGLKHVKFVKQVQKV